MTPTRIAELNDIFRHWGIVFLFAGRHIEAQRLGLITITNGISALQDHQVQAILAKVANYSDFPAGDDPYGEHDFGAFEHAGERIFWKIEYYDRASWKSGREVAAENPADGATTKRVLTIMLASEY